MDQSTRLRPLVMCGFESHGGCFGRKEIGHKLCSGYKSQPDQTQHSIFAFLPKGDASPRLPEGQAGTLNPIIAKRGCQRTASWRPTRHSKTCSAAIYEYSTTGWMTRFIWSAILDLSKRKERKQWTLIFQSTFMHHTNLRTCISKKTGLFVVWWTRAENSDRRIVSSL